MKLFLESHLKLFKANLKTIKEMESLPRPVVKLFNPCGSQTWLICAADGDMLWGYVDMGMGCVEFGSISFNKLQSLQLPMGLKIERDLHWADKPEINYLEKETLKGC